MIRTGHAFFPNPHYRCAKCNRNLWDKRRRLRNPNTCPPIFITTSNASLCIKCFAKDGELHNTKEK